MIINKYFISDLLAVVNSFIVFADIILINLRLFSMTY